MGAISGSSANRKKCYRCVRYCPVKAISNKNNQIRLEEDRCIYYGIYVGEYPRKAKRIESGCRYIFSLAGGKFQPARRTIFLRDSTLNTVICWRLSVASTIYARSNQII